MRRHLNGRIVIADVLQSNRNIFCDSKSRKFKIRLSSIGDRENENRLWSVGGFMIWVATDWRNCFCSILKIEKENKIAIILGEVIVGCFDWGQHVYLFICCSKRHLIGVHTPYLNLCNWIKLSLTLLWPLRRSSSHSIRSLGRSSLAILIGLVVN